MLKKLAVCFFVIACALALCACGAAEEPAAEEGYQFKVGTNYNVELEAREYFIEELRKMYDKSVQYSDNDLLCFNITEEMVLSAVGIKSRDTMDRLFDCIENADIRDYSRYYYDEGEFYYPYPPFTSIRLLIGNEYIGGAEYIELTFPPTMQRFRISFTPEDAENFREYLMSLGENQCFPELYSDDPTARNVFLEDVIDHLEPEVSLHLAEKDSVELNTFKIRTNESAEVLYDCIRNAETIIDLSGINATDYQRPIEIGYIYSSNFDHLTIYSTTQEKYVCIRFAPEDAERLRDYVDALAMAELSEGIQQDSVLEEGLYP